MKGTTLITGGDGMLARAFRMTLGDHVAPGRAELDITDREALRSAFDRLQPGLVVNCAAYTNVTRAEQEPAEAFRINGEGAGNLAAVCSEFGVKMVHFGTDFIFPGRPGGDYREDEPYAPVNQYAASKLEGELRVRDLLADHLILRVSWLYGPSGRNFVSTIGKLMRERDEVRIVADQFNRVTYTFDIVDAVLVLLHHDARGVFHFSNRGVISRYDFTVEIARLMNEREPLNCRITPIPAAEYPDPTPRPENSAMNCDKFEQFTGRAIPFWKDSLARFMREEQILD